MIPYYHVMDIEFSKDQRGAMDTIIDWYKTSTRQLPSFIMGGVRERTSKHTCFISKRFS